MRNAYNTRRNEQLKDDYDNKLEELTGAVEDLEKTTLPKDLVTAMIKIANQETEKRN